MSEYLSVKEFSEKAGVSEQSVYKRLRSKNNPLKPYLKEVEGKKFIRVSALATLYNVKLEGDSTSEQTSEPLPEKEIKTSDSSSSKDASDRVLDILESQLKEYARQIQEKDKQLAEKDSQLSSLLQRLAEANKLLDQQQQLAAIEKKEVYKIEGEGSNGDREEKKRGLFRRFRKK